MSRIMLRGGSVYAHGIAQADSLVIDDGVVAWIGDRQSSVAYEQSVERIIDLSEAFIAPGFVDAHVHLSSTGNLLSGLDLSQTMSAREAIGVLSNYIVKDSHGIVLGHGWDDSVWSDSELWTREIIDEVFGDRLVYISRIDVHSALVSSKLLVTSGVIAEATVAHSGFVDSDEHHLVREVVTKAINPTQRQEAILSALKFAASQGIVCVHENGGPIVSGEGDTRDVVAMANQVDLPRVIVYWGDSDLDKMRELGADGAAGDYFIDGSIGSCTAHLNARYIDEDHSGKEYVTAEQVARHLINCTQQGVQAGFHAIGDAALNSIAFGVRAAIDECGIEAVRMARHRIEHAELLHQDHIELFARAGILLSMQPVFDELWAVPGGMYEQRIGVDRTAQLNPFATLLREGVSLAFGSDSPVTPIDPWRAIRAACEHTHDEHSISARAAFAAHTRGGWRAAGFDDRGVIAVGVPADIAIWRVSELEVQVPDHRVRAWSTDERSGVTGLPLLTEGNMPECLATLRDGKVIFDATGVFAEVH